MISTEANLAHWVWILKRNFQDCAFEEIPEYGNHQDECRNDIRDNVHYDVAMPRANCISYADSFIVIYIRMRQRVPTRIKIDGTEATQL